MNGQPELSGAARCITILANPASGGHRQARLDKIAAILRNADCQVSLRLSKNVGEIEAFCADDSQYADTIAISGGDGSFNEAVRGLTHRKGHCPDVALIPAGTGNVIANAFALPRNGDALATMILNRQTQNFFFGKANNKPFLIMTSVGFDAKVIAANPAWLKRIFGRFSFALTTMFLSFRHQSTPLTIVADGIHLTARMAVVTNMATYGSRYVICPIASTERPDLFLLTLNCDSPMAIFRFGLRLIGNTIDEARGVAIRPVEKVEISAPIPVARQIDGDAVGTTPATIERTDQSFTFIVP